MNFYETVSTLDTLLNFTCFPLNICVECSCRFEPTLLQFFLNKIQVASVFRLCYHNDMIYNK